VGAGRVIGNGIASDAGPRALLGNSPTRLRGGYLLAALVYWIVFPHFGWRGLFIAGALPAFLVIYIRARVPESPVWHARAPSSSRE